MYRTCSSFLILSVRNPVPLSNLNRAIEVTKFEPRSRATSLATRTNHRFRLWHASQLRFSATKLPQGRRHWEIIEFPQRPSRINRVRRPVARIRFGTDSRREFCKRTSQMVLNRFSGNQTSNPWGVRHRRSSDSLIRIESNLHEVCRRRTRVGEAGKVPVTCRRCDFH